MTGIINCNVGELICLGAMIMAATVSIGAAQPAPLTSPTSGPTTRQAAIRTPPAPETPRINGPRVYGARPGRPFAYQVPATGVRPMSFAATGLPAGLEINAETGLITGAVHQRGIFPVMLTAKNNRGVQTAGFDIVISDQIALTPPMGWNNYNAFRMRIDDNLIRAQTDAMVSSGLVNHGYTYMNIDDGWQGTRDDGGNIRPNQKFPDMKALGDYIHSKGLKFGLYSSPGPRTCAKFEGSYDHEDQDAATYGAWGVDYLKYDWCFYDGIAQKIAANGYAAALPGDAERIQAIVAERVPLTEIRPRKPESNERIKVLTAELETILDKLPGGKRKEIDRAMYIAPYMQFGESLAKVDRDIVYSLCQYGMGNVWEWGPSVKANVWRTTRDITPVWPKFTSIINQQVGLEKWASPGHWNDPDMLEIGNGQLTHEEMHTQMTQWCILAAPLLIGCDLTKMDELTLSIYSNDEVIAVNQDALGKQGYPASKNGSQEVWLKPLTGGRWAVALFNRGEEPIEMTYKVSELKISGPPIVRDLWRQRDLPPDTSEVTVTVGPHGAEMFSVAPQRK
ncbi:MAG: putative Ig domain-containing protein [Burkholderiales bacterium]|nr:putative Ig domain-containing protein [Phycisphaerae bacterium]